MKLATSSIAFTTAVSLLFVHDASAYDIRTPSLPTRTATPSSLDLSRRLLLQTALVTPWAVSPAHAANDPTSTISLKVTPLAHTFVTASGTAAKPVRENDASRFCTNAKVVVLWDGGTDASKTETLASDILTLTVQRKAGQGPGVTPGGVQVYATRPALASTGQALSLSVTTASGKVASDNNVKSIVQVAKAMSSGDVLVVGPLPSQGVAANGALCAQLAQQLNTFVGTQKEQGVISVLLQGPTQGLSLNEGGYPISDLLWYAV